MLSTNRPLTIAVFFGGRSPEHDVSIVTAQQLIQAIDRSKHTVVPIYVALDGGWYTGEALYDRRSYVPTGSALKGLTPIQLVAGAALTGRMTLKVEGSGLFKKATVIEADAVIPAFHGRHGEDGAFQGLAQMLEVPCFGSGVLAGAAAMDKLHLKHVLKGLGIAHLPAAHLTKPAGTFVPPEQVAAALEAVGLGQTLPLCVKPRALGSSIGVARANALDEAVAAVADAFRLSGDVVIEPFVADLIEYNVAVQATRDGYAASRIERPERKDRVLSFKDKYKAQGGPKKSGAKTDFGGGEGMADLGRVLDPPELTEADRAQIIGDAIKACAAIGTGGVARVDFLRDGATGALYLNEINTFPGSMSFYLWRGVEGVSFASLVEHELALALARTPAPAQADAIVPPSAQLFSRKGS
jgi:D-alanine-D-alanine ligase